MFQIQSLNAVFRDALIYCDYADPYASLCHEAAQYSFAPEHTAIHQIITNVLDTLNDSTPMTVIALQSMIDAYSLQLNEVLQETKAECTAEHARLKQCEQEFAMLTGIDLKKIPVNFRDSANNIDTVTHLKLKPEALAVLREIKISDFMIAEYREGIGAFADQLLAFEDWRYSEDGQNFVKNYAAARKLFVMNERAARKARKFSQ